MPLVQEQRKIRRVNETPLFQKQRNSKRRNETPLFQKQSYIRRVNETPLFQKQGNIRGVNDPRNSCLVCKDGGERAGRKLSIKHSVDGVCMLIANIFLLFVYTTDRAANSLCPQVCPTFVVNLYIWVLTPEIQCCTVNIIKHKVFGYIFVT